MKLYPSEEILFWNDIYKVSKNLFKLIIKSIKYIHIYIHIFIFEITENIILKYH